MPLVEMFCLVCQKFARGLLQVCVKVIFTYANEFVAVLGQHCRNFMATVCQKPIIVRVGISYINMTQNVFVCLFIRSLENPFPSKLSLL